MPPSIPLPELPTVHRKYCVEADAQWQFIHVSVMNEDGSPSTGLQKNNFRVGYFDVTYVVTIWREMPLFVSESANGFYLLWITSDTTYSIFPDTIFTVEAFQTQFASANKVISRGQCLATNQSAGPVSPSSGGE